MNATAIKKMSNNEKMALIEELWTSIDEPDSLPSPEWHGDVLAERMSSVEDGTAKYITLDSLRNKK